MSENPPVFTLLELAVALEGMAIMRRWPADDEQVRARLREVRLLLDGSDDPALTAPIAVRVHDVSSGYERWAPAYDRPNPAIDLEQRVVHPMLRRAPVGRALDAGCGTGRHAAFLADLGHIVDGVDVTPAMLAVARAKVPGATFHVGTFDAVPAAGATFDVVVCSLALTHTADLGPAIAEFARVLRPGGWLVVADIHPVAVVFGAGAVFPDEPQTLSYVPNLKHELSSYVAAARAAGLTVEECHEIALEESEMAMSPAFAVAPEAVRQALLGMPFLVVWRFERPAHAHA